MDYQNKHFQRFLRMKDKDVEKLLSAKNEYLIKYVRRNNDILEVVSYANERFLISDGHTVLKYDLRLIQYTFERYILSRKAYAKSFFRTIGMDATASFVVRRSRFYYGEENVWASSIPGKKFVTIKFPSIVITNSMESNHEMKDVFIRFTIMERGLTSMCIARTTVTEAEWGSYLFSHTSGTIPGEWYSTLCMGSTDMKIKYDQAVDSNSFSAIDSVIASLLGYLSWESLEGNPYRRMHDIGVSMYQGRIAPDDRSDTIKAIAIIANSDLALEYRLTDTGFSIITDKCTDMIDDLLSASPLIENKIRYNGKSYSELKKRELDVDENISDVFFKGERVKIKIEPVEAKLNAVEERVNLHTLKSAVTKLSAELTEFLTNKDYE